MIDVAIAKTFMNRCLKWVGGRFVSEGLGCAMFISLEWVEYIHNIVFT